MMGRKEAAILAAALCLLVGCGEQQKIKECKALIAVINGGVDKIQKGTATVPDGGAAVGELRGLADEMDGIAKEAAKVEITQPELDKLAKAYEAMVKEVAAAARELATAVDKVDMENMTKAQGRMDKAVKREGPLVESLNKYCQAP